MVPVIRLASSTSSSSRLTVVHMTLASSYDARNTHHVMSFFMYPPHAAYALVRTSIVNKERAKSPRHSRPARRALAPVAGEAGDQLEALYVPAITANMRERELLQTLIRESLEFSTRCRAVRVSDPSRASSPTSCTLRFSYYVAYFWCAPGRIRTCDRRIRSPLLCPLSYGRILLVYVKFFASEVEPKTPMAVMRHEQSTLEPPGQWSFRTLLHQPRLHTSAIVAYER